MDLLPPAELLPPLCGLSPPAAPGSGSHRRCASAPTLSVEAVAEAALQLETTPCSVLELHSLDDDVSLYLQRTLKDAQRELLEAVQAGVLKGSAEGGAGPGAQGPRSEDAGGGSDRSDRSQAPGCAQHPGGQQQQQAGGSSGAAQHSDADGGVELELELAGLPARDREAALKRFKNREAARRSRERKAGRITGLQAEVDCLRANNFVLLKCVEEVAHKALAARDEQRRLRDKLAKLQAEQPPAAPVSAARHSPLLGGAGGHTCTPPAAARAAALERQLLEMEAGPASPTQLLLPRWPEQAVGAAAAPPSVPLQARPTSAELRRELRRAVAGEQEGATSGSGIAADGQVAAAVAAGAAEPVAWAGASAGPPAGGSVWPSSAATLHHLLHPSPVASRSRRAQTQQLAHAPLQGPPPAGAVVVAAQACPAALLTSRAKGLAGGPALLRTCSDPGELAAAFAALPAMPALPAGRADPWFLPGLVA